MCEIKFTNAQSSARFLGISTPILIRDRVQKIVKESLTAGEIEKKTKIIK